VLARGIARFGQADCTSRSRIFEGSTMDDAGFWDIIERSLREGQGDQDLQLQAVAEQLRALARPEVQAFAALLDARMRESRCHQTLYGAGCLINENQLSDDGFQYFCAALIAQGREVYSAALADPDSLAATVDPEWAMDFEELLPIADQIYELRFGESMPTPPATTERARGESWDINDAAATAARLPRLSSLMAERG
jgi:hypothetical protein